MQLTISSDGTAHGTRLLTEDGELISGVQLIEWKVSMDAPVAIATVKLAARIKLDAKLDHVIFERGDRVGSVDS